MQLDLSDSDAELLREVLDSAVSRLRSEIAHTDSATYRRDLKERQERLRSVLDLVGGPSTAQRHDQAG